MLTEIENTLLKTIREKLTELPSENISAYSKPRGFPAIVISNLKFKFKKADLAENIEQRKTELQDTMSGDGNTKIFKLNQAPIRNSVSIESPPGVILTEKTNYVINYDNSSVIFLEAPDKGKKNMLIKYNARQSIMTLKSLRIKALYSIEVLSQTQAEVDTLAEKVVKAFLSVEDDLLSEGLEIKSLGGTFSQEEEFQKITLKYLIEKEISIELVVGPIEKIEITRKDNVIKTSA